MLLEYCPRCNRMVVARQVERDYKFINNQEPAKNIEQMVCNICGVTVSVQTDRVDIQKDLKAIHKLIIQKEKPPTYVSFR